MEFQLDSVRVSSWKFPSSRKSSSGKTIKMREDDNGGEHQYLNNNERYYAPIDIECPDLRGTDSFKIKE
jgi:hypothetical protein